LIRPLFKLTSFFMLFGRLDQAATFHLGLKPAAGGRQGPNVTGETALTGAFPLSFAAGFPLHFGRR
jgi:hypothetical protein